jgi:hypothetical protein
LGSAMQTQRHGHRTPYYTAPKGDQRRPRCSTRSASSSSGRTPEFDDNLVGFSLVPAWLLLVHKTSNQPAEYPFPRSLENSPAPSTMSSQSNSPLNTPLATQSQPSRFNLKSDMSISSELEDRLYWEEEAVQWSDEGEQGEDLEAVYNSIKY